MNHLVSKLICTSILLASTSTLLAHGPAGHSEKKIGSVFAPNDQASTRQSNNYRQLICLNNQTFSAYTSYLEFFAQFDAYLGPCMHHGDRRSVGNGYISSFAQINPDGKPYSIGLLVQENALTNLPKTRNDGANCFDTNQDNQLDPKTECIGGHAWEFEFPHQVRNTIAPFKWALVNWNPDGHPPYGVYDVGHFDMHFYIQPQYERNIIRTGPCDGLMNCNDFAKAIKPLAADFMPVGYTNLKAVEARMGNHLIDLQSPEFNGKPFSSTFIWGTYDGQISFLEPMLRLELFQKKPFFCQDIPQPKRYAQPGNYPQKYCVKYYPARKEYHVTLEQFQAK